MNEKIVASGNKVIKRIYRLDTVIYQEGALSTKTKEMLELSTTMVPRCSDCIKYHLEKCYEQGVTTDEIFEIFGVANLVGETIVIQHTRRAVEYLEELKLNSFKTFCHLIVTLINNILKWGKYLQYHLRVKPKNRYLIYVLESVRTL